MYGDKDGSLKAGEEAIMITHVEVMMYQAGCNRSNEILLSRLHICSKKEALASDYISSIVRPCHYL